MTTGQEIYEAALVLIDANNDADTTEYESKAMSILNVLRGEVYPYSRDYDEDTPVPPLITDMDNSIVGIDDYLCQSVMPYGLGAHLLLDENPTTASYLNQRYQELLMERKRGVGNPVHGSEDIEDLYDDGNWFNRFTRWN